MDLLSVRVRAPSSTASDKACDTSPLETTLVVPSDVALAPVCLSIRASSTALRNLLWADLPPAKRDRLMWFSAVPGARNCLSSSRDQSEKCGLVFILDANVRSFP